MNTFFYDYATEAFNSHKSITSIEIKVSSALTTEEVDPIINKAIEDNTAEMHEFMKTNNFEFLSNEWKPAVKENTATTYEEAHAIREKLENELAVTGFNSNRYDALVKQINNINCDFWADFAAYK